MSKIAFENELPEAKIKVIGVGGCGGNLVNYMSERSIYGVRYMAINTDSQALCLIKDDIECVQIGKNKTRGLGTGADPKIGAEVAREEIERLRDIVRGLDMVFITAGMGKGTGTGSSPVIAEIAKEEGVLTVAIVTLPFSYERRQVRAEKGVAKLAQYVDSLVLVPNNKLLDVLGEEVSAEDAFTAANEVLYNAVRGVSDIIHKPGLINVDFNDVRTAMSGKGKAVIGSALRSGSGRDIEAAKAALHSPLMEDVDLSSSAHVLVNVTGKKGKVTVGEYERIQNVISEYVQDFKGEMFPGLVYDESMSDEELRVTVIVTGVQDTFVPEPEIMVNDSIKINDSALVSARKKQEQQRLLDKHQGDIRGVPAVLRRQIN